MEAKDDGGGEGKAADEGKAAGGGGDERGEEVADEAVLMECLGMIEDMFFDEVDLGDDGFGDSDDEGGAWNQAESKEGASLREEIRALEDRAADSFRDKIASDAEEKHGGGGGGGGDGGTEFTLEHTDLHRQFCELIESRLDTCLRKQGRSADDLLAAIKRIDGRPSSSTSYLSMASREIVTTLNEVGSGSSTLSALHHRLTTARSPSPVATLEGR